MLVAYCQSNANLNSYLLQGLRRQTFYNMTSPIYPYSLRLGSTSPLFLNHIPKFSILKSLFAEWCRGLEM